MKKCPKCKREKDLEKFGFDRNTKDKRCCYCKECIRKKSAAQKKNNPECAKKYATEYRRKNRDLLRKKARFTYWRDIEKRKEQSTRSYNKHKDEIAIRRKIKRMSQKAREKENLRQKKWRKENPELFRSYVRKWQINNRNKTNAHAKIHRAIESGKLIRNECCEKCNKKCKPEAHHEDYSKPFDVIWLCRKCHAELLERVVGVI
jgi:hypothetical protein